MLICKSLFRNRVIIYNVDTPQLLYCLIIDIPIDQPSNTYHEITFLFVEFSYASIHFSYISQ